MTPRSRTYVFCTALLFLAVAAFIAATFSPLLAWRQPVYILSGFAGIIALILLMFQPLLAIAVLPDVAKPTQQQLHRILGLALLISVIAHVAGLWITSPPDVIDALTFSSPTLFTPFGVIAMWAVFFTAGLFAMRRKLKLAPRIWKRVHLALTWLIVPGTVVHAMLIEGTMESFTKATICGLSVIILTAVTRQKLARR